MARSPDNLEADAAREFAAGTLSTEGYQEIMDGRRVVQSPPFHPPIRGASDRYTTPEDLISRRGRFTQDQLEALAGPRGGRPATYGDVRDMLLVDNNPLSNVPDFPPPNLRNLTSQIVQVGRN